MRVASGLPQFITQFFTMNNYINAKVTVWKRFHFTDIAYMKGIAEIVREHGLKEAIDPQVEYHHTETLTGTERVVPPAQNKDEPTIEVFENGRQIWNNNDNQ